MKPVACSANQAQSTGLLTLNLNVPAVQRQYSNPSPTAFTENEKAELHECERILQRGLATFFEVGNALLRIRDKGLYRRTHKTFEDYCQNRWHIGRSYAWRVISAAERVNLLPDSDSFPKPANEFQIRPFLRLSTEEFPGAWRRAVGLAQAGKVTRQVAEAVIHEIKPPEKTGPTPSRRSQRRSNGKFSLGQILVLLHEIRRCIEKHQDEEAIAALLRIEGLLCGPER